MIAGRYEPLADGLARDTDLGRVVRLRWIARIDDVDDPRLSHPNVVRVFDIGEHDGRRFAAVEHVEGLPLQLVAPLSAEDAVVLGVRAARALAAAHALGLVHAGEILVRADGVPKLSGFRPGRPGPDVRALAEALNDASPGLPSLRASAPEELVRELERARPAVTVPLTPVEDVTVVRRTHRRRPPLAALIAVLAVLALAVGLAAAFGGGGSSRQPPVQVRVAPVQPVPHAAKAEQQAQNLAAWLSRYSSR